MSELGALGPIVARKHAEVEALRCGAAAMWAKAESLPPVPAPEAVLRGGAVIAEMKRRSPSGGDLRTGLDVVATACGFERAGAAAVAVLTDGRGFGGSLLDLHDAAASVSIPVLRKDFVIDPLQVAEARVAGAAWVLLIVAVLDDRALDECMAGADRCTMHALLEVHDAPEARRAVAAGAACIGVNNRDLRTLRTDLDTFSRVRGAIPDAVPCVAESGISSPEDAARLVAEGADAVLVGEALMRAPSPEERCAQMVAASHAAAQARA